MSISSGSGVVLFDWAGRAIGLNVGSFDASLVSHLYMEHWKACRMTVRVSAGLPDNWVILSRRDEPPALILASRRSRRRACLCVGDSELSSLEN